MGRQIIIYLNMTENIKSTPFYCFLMSVGLCFILSTPDNIYFNLAALYTIWLITIVFAVIYDFIQSRRTND